jgi:hypothetical protein
MKFNELAGSDPETELARKKVSEKTEQGRVEKTKAEEQSLFGHAEKFYFY